MTLPNSTESKEPKIDPGTGYVEPKEEPKEEPSNGEPKLDEHGYTVVEKESEEPSKEEPKEEPKAEEKIDPATGYGDEPKEEPKKEEPKADPETDEGKLEASMDESLGELPEDYDKESIKKFALDNKFSPDQLKAYVEMAKSEEAQAVEDNESQVKAQRSSWHKELKDDPEFGGENFVKNVDRVEKVLQNHLPETKKVLTDRGTMLPPYIMRDLLGIAKTLNPTTELVNGDPSKPVAKENGNFLDNMYQ